MQDGDIDFFAVYCRDNDGVYLIPIEDVPTVREARLRVTPARNGQARFVRFAQQFEIARVSIV